MTDIDNIKPINLILQQAQKVYELRMELPDGATIPLYGEIAKMGCLIHEYEKANGCGGERMNLQIEAEVYGVQRTDEGIKCEVYRPCFDKKGYQVDLFIPEVLMDGLKGGDRLMITIQQKQVINE